MCVFYNQWKIKYSSSVNYYYKQVIISIKKHFTGDLRWDCNEGINRWVLIFALKWIYQQSVEGRRHQYGFVLMAQRRLNPAQNSIYIYVCVCVLQYHCIRWNVIAHTIIISPFLQCSMQQVLSAILLREDVYAVV